MLTQPLDFTRSNDFTDFTGCSVAGSGVTWCKTSVKAKIILEVKRFYTHKKILEFP